MPKIRSTLISVSSNGKIYYFVVLLLVNVYCHRAGQREELSYHSVDYSTHNCSSSICQNYPIRDVSTGWWKIVSFPESIKWLRGGGANRIRRFCYWYYRVHLLGVFGPGTSDWNCAMVRCQFFQLNLFHTE